MEPLVVQQLKPLQSLCKKHRVTVLYLFGSAVSGNFSQTSDLDFAVIFEDGMSPLDHGASFLALKESLEGLFEREIDLLSYRAIKNPIFKETLDHTKITLYAA